MAPWIGDSPSAATTRSRTIARCSGLSSAAVVDAVAAGASLAGVDAVVRSAVLVIVVAAVSVGDAAAMSSVVAGGSGVPNACVSQIAPPNTSAVTAAIASALPRRIVSPQSGTSA